MVTFTWLLQTINRRNLLRMFLTTTITSIFIIIRGYFWEIKCQMAETMYLYDTRWYKINSEKCSQDKGGKKAHAAFKRTLLLKKITTLLKSTHFKPIAMQCRLPMFAITDNLKYLDLHLLWSKGTGAKLSTRSSE